MYEIKELGKIQGSRKIEDSTLKAILGNGSCIKLNVVYWGYNTRKHCKEVRKRDKEQKETKHVVCSVFLL